MDISTPATGEIRSSETAKSTKKYFLESMSVRTPKPNMNVQSYLKDGLIDDWDLFDKVLDYTFGKHLRCDPSNHPLLFTEPVTNTKQKREKLCELVFEKCQAPGFYISKNAVLSA